MLPSSGSLALALPAVRKAVELWNQKPGQLWGALAKLDEERFSTCIDLVDRVFDGDLLPKDPGPYKRLAAFVVGTQYIAPYDWPSNFRSDIWDPRLAVWSVGPLGAMLLNNTTPRLPPVIFPTLHVQVEVLAHIRKIGVSGRRQLPKLEIDVFAERVGNLAHIFEISAYASYPNPDRLGEFRELTASCLIPPSWTDDFALDRYFLNRKFYDFSDDRSV